MSAPIKCIFLCEFHPVAGPKIVGQVPQNYISQELFATVNSYVIPKAQLQRCFLSVSLLGEKIIGFPVQINDRQYARNAYYFNLCFVFDLATRTLGYEPVVRKIAEYLLSMELSTHLLSQQTSNRLTFDRLFGFFERIRGDINRTGMCILQEGNTTIPLCVVPHYPATVTVLPHDAAVLRNEFKMYICAQWDLTTLRILPFIDGFCHMRRIAAMADVAIELVIDCVRHLVLLGVAQLIPVFQYSNIYRPTPKLSLLAKCRAMQRRCITKCSKMPERTSVRNVFRIFASMAHGATFGELCVRFNPAALHINEKQMVMFGLLEGLIRRVNKYPITVKRNLFTGNDDNGGVQQKKSTGTATPATATTPLNSNSNSMYIDCVLPRSHEQRRSARLCEASNDRCAEFGGDYVTSGVYTGGNSFDEICCATGLSCQQLDTHLDRDKNVIVLLK